MAPASCALDIQGSDSIAQRLAMQIKKHDRSHMVELRDGSAWRIWPGDILKTLHWQPTTEIDVADIDDEGGAKLANGHMFTITTTGRRINSATSAGNRSR